MEKTQKRRSTASSERRAVDPRRAKAFRTKLSAWFARERRDLPWRASRDAYRVWISEAMLQQTRVETVLPHYTRFLARFPDVRALAVADVDDVLVLWSGLGYYRRARTLHAAARVIVDRHAGAFPREREAALELPGVGPYTAGAVLSIAYGRPEALVDGNVGRVFARWFELEGAPGTPGFDARAWELARALVPSDGTAGDWNQALMELGALVCVPRNPDCGHCPVHELCAARASGRTEELPTKKARRAAIDVELVVLIERTPEGVLLEQRPEGGRMAGMWQFPTIELGVHGRLAPLDWPSGARVVLGATIGELTHTITHHRIRAHIRSGAVRSAEIPKHWRRVHPAELERLALTGLTKKAVAAPFFRS